MLTKTKIFASVSAIAMLAVTSVQAQVGEASRQIDQIVTEISGTVNLAAFGGFTIATRELVGIKWDDRCASVPYTFNTTTPANPGTAAQIAPAVLAQTVQTGLDRWNDNPSSYIEMNVTNLSPLGARPRGFDFINEVTFFTPVGFGPLASSPSTSLTADTTFSPGDDLDGDGDSDVYDPVAAGQNVCTDIDGDGDIEFPAGFYEAGTILDNDVQFSSTVTWELGATDSFAADVDAVSTHEFGHSHGLSHAMNNQTSGADPTPTTMFPAVPTAEGPTEMGIREPHPDDLAHSALIYPEGSTRTGPGALQAGDVAFSRAYDLVTGTVSSVDNNTLIPRAGANVRIEDFRTGELIGEAFSGVTTVSDLDGDPTTPDLFAFAENVTNGDYVVPVLKQRRRSITATIQAPDGTPAGPGGFSTHVTVANLANPLDFIQENYSGPRLESNNESWRGDVSFPVRPRSGVARNIDFITNDAVIQRNGGAQAFAGLGLAGATSVTYIESIDGQAVLQMLEDNLLTDFAFFATSFDTDQAPIFSRASLYIGEVTPGTSVTFSSRIATETNVVADNDDFTAVSINPTTFERTLRTMLRRNPNLDVIMVVEDDDTVLGRGGFPTTQMGLDLSATGTSFLSSSGGPVTPAPFGITWNMELRYAPRGK